MKHDTGTYIQAKLETQVERDGGNDGQVLQDEGAHIAAASQAHTTLGGRLGDTRLHQHRGLSAAASASASATTSSNTVSEHAVTPCQGSGVGVSESTTRATKRPHPLTCLPALLGLAATSLSGSPNHLTVGTSVAV